MMKYGSHKKKYFLETSSEVTETNVTSSIEPIIPVSDEGDDTLFEDYGGMEVQNGTMGNITTESNFGTR